MIRIENVYHKHEGETGSLFDVNVEFPKGTISAVLGDYNSGKTTLMMCIGQFLKPQRGRITLDGTDIYTIPEQEFRHKVGIVFKKSYLFKHLTVLENLAFGLIHVYKIKKVRAEREARAILDHLSIIGISDKYPAQITSLQAQRVAIARSLLLRPDYVLLEEPLEAFSEQFHNVTCTRDETNINEALDDLVQWLKKLIDETNFIIFTHDPLFVRKVANQGIAMSQGKIFHSGDGENLQKN
ncbi:MAG: ATP-binding cassette domain-containing protein [bacterium]